MRVLVVGLHTSVTMQNANAIHERIKALTGLESVIIDNCSAVVLVDDASQMVDGDSTLHPVE